MLTLARPSAACLTPVLHRRASACISSSLSRAVASMAATEAATYDLYLLSNPSKPDEMGGCPFCVRALLTLEEKGANYTRHYPDMQNKPAWLLEVNPSGTVPVMKLPKEETDTLAKDKWLISSDDIADYLETKHSASGQIKLGKSADIPDVAGKLAPCLFMYLKSSSADEAEKKQALVEQLTQLDSHLTSNGPLLCGKDLSAGDLSLAPKLYMAQLSCKHFKSWDPYTGLTAVSEYVKAIEARPSWHKSIYKTEALIEGLEKMLSK